MIDEKDMTLAMDWHGSNILGWWCSEKIEDCRAYWRDGEFWTRGGNLIKAPKWFKKGLPKFDIDGGIWAGRGGFQTARIAVQNGDKWFDEVSANGHPLQFVPFDLPGMIGRWNKRIAEANKSIRACSSAAPLNFWRLTIKKSFIKFMLSIRPLDGEGVCFRHPDVDCYEVGRTGNLLRFKFIDK